MWSSFLISFNTVMPIALLLLIGALLKKKGTITGVFEVEANRIVFNWALPMYLFKTIYGADVGEGFSLRLVIFGIAAMVIGYGLLALILPRFYTRPEDRRRIGVFISCSFHGGCAVPGIILAQSLLGPEASLPFFLAMPIWSAFNPVFSTTAFSAYLGGKMSARGTLKLLLGQVYKNPIIWGVLLSLAANLVKLPLPAFVRTGIDYIAALSTPLALITLGSRLNWEAFKHDFKQSMTCGVGIKLIAFPLAGLVIAWLLGFTKPELAALFLHLATPVGFGAYSVAVALDTDSRFFGNSLIVSHTLSSLTLFIEIFILSTMGVF